jgi:hypothetical protein
LRGRDYSWAFTLCTGVVLVPAAASFLEFNTPNVNKQTPVMAHKISQMRKGSVLNSSSVRANGGTADEILNVHFMNGRRNPLARRPNSSSDNGRQSAISRKMNDQPPWRCGSATKMHSQLRIVNRDSSVVCLVV